MLLSLQLLKMLFVINEGIIYIYTNNWQVETPASTDVKPGACLLLDFTKNPSYAAFFAAKEWINNKDKNDIPEYLCVWGLNLTTLKNNTYFTN